VFRRTVAPVRLGDYTIPPGRVIQVNITATHRQGWGPGEETFRPERHLEAPPPGSTAVPFGLAPRVCLGKPLAELEMRLLLTRLLQRVSLSLEPQQDLTLAVSPTPLPRSGLLVRVERR
jgi:cytochrome P450